MDRKPHFLCEECSQPTDVPKLYLGIDFHLLHSNHVPSEFEVLQTSKLLREETWELDRYEGKCSESEMPEAGKQILDIRIAHLRSITSVQRRVPVELWEKIFAIACLWKAGYFLEMTTTHHGSHTMMFPILLTHVCSRWRNIATGCPRLWASISIDLAERYSNNTMKLVETFLANSAACPLDLRILASFNHTPDEYDRGMWKFLTDHFSRSKRLSFNFYFNDTNPLTSFRDQDISFNDLSSFRSFISPDDNPFWKALRQAPNLTSVHVRHARMCKPSSFPYPQLTTLIIESVVDTDVERLLQVLEDSINLRCLTLKYFTSTGRTHGLTSRRVEMPFLRTLAICQEENSCLTPMDDPSLDVLFSSLAMPALSTFKLSCISDFPVARHRSHHWPSSLLTMLRSSSTTLRDISLFLGPISTDSDDSLYHTWAPLSILLETTPHLTHFNLEEGSGYLDEMTVYAATGHLPSESLLSALTHERHNRKVLPELVSLTIRGIKLNSKIVSKVLGLAALRSPSRLTNDGVVRPLKQLRIIPHVSPNFSLKPHMLATIETLEREGVKVVIEKEQ
ncbi:hypothetical protein E1B28_005196 [Marasmius oreades]|uniref:F-box domain-containing protein n=1 Tax=Marasmius oreades TaxID=181124 RepID=A0A9P7V064_9AGAR|nr:uncharacterized protein E1B28_005196 [Marasmius oreades]KAG7097883.1 hypothetical protein E1B28_005196 [Marasmius oreades]